MNDHCKGVTKRYPLISGGGTQDVRVISEADLMRLIISSKLPAAERFERWVFEEVLPSIRKTGSYKLGYYENYVEQLENDLDDLKQIVSSFRACKGTFNIWEVSMQLFHAVPKLGDGNVRKTMADLVKHGLIQKDATAKNQQYYKPYLKDVRKGYYDVRILPNGEPEPILQNQIAVTSDGLLWIMRELQTALGREYFRERPVFDFTRHTQRRLYFDESASKRFMSCR